MHVVIQAQVWSLGNAIRLCRYGSIMRQSVNLAHGELLLKILYGTFSGEDEIFVSTPSEKEGSQGFELCRGPHLDIRSAHQSLLTELAHHRSMHGHACHVNGPDSLTQPLTSQHIWIHTARHKSGSQPQQGRSPGLWTGGGGFLPA